MTTPDPTFSLHTALSVGIDKALRDLGADLTGCTPSMLTGHVIKELRAAGLHPAPATGEDVIAKARQVLDDSVLTHTGRSVGDIASGRVADALAAAGLLASAPADRARDTEIDKGRIDKALSLIDARDQRGYRIVECATLLDQVRAALSGEATDAQ